MKEALGSTPHLYLPVLTSWALECTERTKEGRQKCGCTALDCVDLSSELHPAWTVQRSSAPSTVLPHA